ncbi:hypothetical protein AAVH_32496 [Aphelenchoides avenae]|nr:hypothetical protein AAVH_32496 [Aphelenchus avenae]
MRDPEDSLPPPITWVEIMTKALDSKLETARLLRRDSSRETAKICKRKVAEKLVREVPPEQVFKELDEEILHGLHHLSEDAKQRLEDLKNKWGVDATTPFKKIDVEKLSDADCRAVLPKALEAAGFLMLCHDANKEIRRLENPLNVKARQCAARLDELNERLAKSVAELVAATYNEDERGFLC